MTSRAGGRRALPLTWALVLLMAALLAGAVVALLAGARRALVESAELGIRSRLDRTARELAMASERLSTTRAANLRVAARDPAVRRALQQAAAERAGIGDDPLRLPVGGRPATVDSAVREALEEVRSDTLFSAIELWDADGRRIAWIGDDLAPAQRPPPPVADRDSTWHSPLRRVDGVISVWTAVPVVDRGTRLGWVAYQRPFVGSPTTVRTVRALTGEDVAVRVRNLDGSLWIEAAGGVATPPLSRDSGRLGLMHDRVGVGRLIAVEAPVRGGPYAMVLEVPARAAAARAAPTLRRLALLGLVVVALGAVVAWLLGRRITRPLSALTQAAEEVSRGTYEHAVVTSGGDEVARLGASFDAMARQVASARHELERRAADAIAQAEELSRANGLLRDAITEAERASRAKSDFLAVMSHELRTPLNAIGGYTELLTLGIYGEVDSAQRDALERIGRSQRHLLSLIDDVLSFARLEGGRAEFVLRDVVMLEVVASVEALVAPQARARRIALVLDQCDAALVARADDDKLRQVVLNLLANAIKFTPEGGRVQVSCDADAGHVHLHVTDTGHGIPAERLDAIFEPFVQVDRALNRPTEGVGLGLAISRDLARGMGGALSVRSTIGEGSTFTLTLVRALPGITPPEAVARGVAPGGAVAPTP